MGHFLDMVLKDMFVKIALLDGKYAKFVPGWDMHGLPIEYETLKYFGITDFHASIRSSCGRMQGARALLARPPARASPRMGTFGLFDHPYRDDRSVF